ncbi:hypothetical protein T4D_5444 [Trichinella pseudospiralis]|uniref:Uncharacterized protein n=1 Tax=Trichinella pseudospiralis TaxID=6337 RepID=A0A0V1FAX4_TRIPS|nr:hypothetical protein T4D_5444 [Trichinella pseudospiralis]
MDMHFHSTAFGKHVMIDPMTPRLSAHRSTDEHDSCSSWCLLEQRNKSRLLGGRDNEECGKGWKGKQSARATTAICTTGNITQNVEEIHLFFQYDVGIAIVRTIKNKLFSVIQ